MENLIELLKKIITNVLTALYQPFWFAVILTVFLLFFYLYAYKPIDTGKGIRAAFRAWWQEFRTSLFFRKLFLLTFFTVMILFQTLINRNMWINPLSDIMGGWWIWHTAADGTVTLTTECFENIALMLPFTALLLWTVAEKIFCGRKITFGRCVWISTKTAFLFSLAIEFLQLFLRLGTFPRRKKKKIKGACEYEKQQNTETQKKGEYTSSSGFIYVCFSNGSGCDFGEQPCG